MAAGIDGAAIAGIRRGLRRRNGAVVAGLAAVCALLVIVGMCLGDYPIGPLNVLQSLLSPMTGAAQPGIDFVVLGVRLPRVVMALLAGGAFGLSGIIFQTVLRNPLASPDLLGISTGASAGAVVCIVVLGWSGAPVSAGALGGALVTAVAIYLLAWRDGVSPYRIVLIGIGIAAILTAVISYLFTQARLTTVQQALTWLTGSLNSITVEQIAPLAAAMVVLVPGAFLLTRALGVLQLGDDTARALGGRVEASRLALLLTAVALAAFAAGAVGPLAFVAFVSGPIARRLLGPAGLGFGAAALVGANVTVGADIIAQHFLGNNQLPVGVVTGAFGAVFLVWLLVASNRAGRVA